MLKSWKLGMDYICIPVELLDSAKNVLHFSYIKNIQCFSCHSNNFFFFSPWFDCIFLKNFVVTMSAELIFLDNRIACSSNAARSSGAFPFLSLCCCPLAFYNGKVLPFAQKAQIISAIKVPVTKAKQSKNIWTHTIICIPIQKAPQACFAVSHVSKPTDMCAVLPDFSRIWAIS